MKEIAVPGVPVMDPKKYAEEVGLSPDVVRGQIARGQLPTIKIGRRRLVNVAALHLAALESAR